MAHGARDLTQWLNCLPTKCEVMNLTPGTKKKKKKVFGSWFQPMGHWLNYSGPEVKQNITVEGHEAEGAPFTEARKQRGRGRGRERS